MTRRKLGNPFKASERLVEKRMLQAFKDSLGEDETAKAQRPASPAMQERLDQQAHDWLVRQPRILNGLDDFNEVEGLALSNDTKGMAKFLRKRASEAAKAQLTYWKKFFRLQRQGKGRPEGQARWVTVAVSMRAYGRSWDEIAQNCLPQKWQQDPYDAKHIVRKAVRDYCRRTGIPPSLGVGENPPVS